MKKITDGISIVSIQPCRRCDGAGFQIRTTDEPDGLKNVKHECFQCQGTGRLQRTLSLRELKILLEKVAEDDD